MKQTLDLEIEKIIQNALEEDVGSGDHSSLACIPANEVGKAKLLVKDTGVIAGVDFAKKIFHHVDPSLKITTLIEDGKRVKHSDIVFYVEGNVQSILKTERVALNAMQRMSAIATKTKKFARLIAHTKTKIIDTRKTTPGIRALEKWAVKIGGGENHRFGLYDMVMIKDNHIDFAGGIAQAIEKTKQYLVDKNLELNIIVEARNLKEVKKILDNGPVYRILLDNFSPADIYEAVQVIGNLCQTEASGGISERNLVTYADCGVDFISSGALTHSVVNMDLSLKATL